MRSMHYILIVLLFALTGCEQAFSHLILKEDDNPAEITAKVLTRVVIFVPTFFNSEGDIAVRKRFAQDPARYCNRLASRYDRYTGGVLVPNGGYLTIAPLIINGPPTEAGNRAFSNCLRIEGGRTPQDRLEHGPVYK